MLHWLRKEQILTTEVTYISNEISHFRLDIPATLTGCLQTVLHIWRSGGSLLFPTSVNCLVRACSCQVPPTLNSCYRQSIRRRVCVLCFPYSRQQHVTGFGGGRTGLVRLSCAQFLAIGGIMLQAGRSRVRFSMRWMLPVTLWPEVNSASNRNEYQK
jgi:hypothetical protein